jgi:protein-tyrosine phosphatase
MIDLHCHILPGIDDGSPDLATSLEMARIAVADGITTTFCTPHIYPGLYENNGPDIERRVANLQLVLNDKGIPLTLSYGADAHLVPDMLEGVKSKRIPTLGGSRYLLLEPSHNVRPPRFQESVFALIAAGYTPVITHPERLTWIGDHYNDFTSLAKSGAWLQVTAGALLGRFGKFAQQYAEKFIDEGWTAVIASDAHTTTRRAPQIAEAVELAARLVGREEANRMVVDRPRAVCDNRPPGDVLPPPALLPRESANEGKMHSLVSRWFGRASR